MKKLLLTLPALAAGLMLLSPVSIADVRHPCPGDDTETVRHPCPGDDDGKTDRHPCPGDDDSKTDRHPCPGDDDN